MKKQRFSFMIFVSVALCFSIGKAKGQPFPSEPTARLGKGTIHDMAYSPDEKLFAVAGSLGVWLYDAKTLKEIGRFEGRSEQIDFSRDGKLLASSSADAAIRLWDVEAQKQVGLLEGHTPGRAPGLAFTPDGRWLASGGWSEIILLWDVEAEQQVGQLDGFGLIAMSPNGNFLALRGAGGIGLWNVETQQLMGRY